MGISHLALTNKNNKTHLFIYALTKLLHANRLLHSYSQKHRKSCNVVDCIPPPKISCVHATTADTTYAQYARSSIASITRVLA